MLRRSKRLFKLALSVGALAAFLVLVGLGTLRYLTVQEQQRIDKLIQQTVTFKHPQRMQPQTLLNDVEWLADERLAGRFPGSPGSLQARNYITERLQELGLSPAGSEGFHHPFAYLGGTAVNVLAKIEGSESSEQLIVVTAHYDHVGERHGEIYPGADDNASGVAALLGMAKYFAEHPPKHSILLAALDAEEDALNGAQALFTTGMLQPDKILFNLNLDMLSRDTDNTLFAVGSYHTPWLSDVVKAAQHESSVRLVAAHDRPMWRVGWVPDWTDDSDHLAFHQRAIPFLYLGVPDHADYHQPTDTFEKVDQDFFVAASEAALSVVISVDNALQQIK
ncbi:M28 family peptidase [Alteromonas flava]|uniref:M28 family peptidase n=1 Tax=Alteromonas flava TaxID=2048003 RepID=UPI000C283762|nr:M28 family peptidase [Alteromonas flava]